MILILYFLFAIFICLIEVIKLFYCNNVTLYDDDLKALSYNEYNEILYKKFSSFCLNKYNKISKITPLNNTEFYFIFNFITHFVHAKSL